MSEFSEIRRLDEMLLNSQCIKPTSEFKAQMPLQPALDILNQRQPSLNQSAKATPKELTMNAKLLEYVEHYERII